MKTRTVQLDDLVTIVGDGTPSKARPEYFRGDIPWVSPKDMKTWNIFDSQDRITDEAISHSTTTLIQPGAVLVVIRSGVLKHTLPVAINCVPVTVNQDLKALVCSDRITAEYLARALQAISSKLLSTVRGTTADNISTDVLRQLLIPLPGLSEQRRIAELLEQADRLRRTRRYALELSDTVLPAAFLELFGDPVRNSKGWRCTELEEFAKVDRGKFTPRPRNDPSYYGGKFPFIQTGDISNSGGRLNSWTQTLNEKGIRVSRRFPPGTVVIAIVGATIGMTAILEVELYCPDSVVGIQVNPDMTTAEYIEMLLRFWRPVFLAQAPETARANINLDTLRPLQIPLPPVPFQQKFVSLVDRHERLRAVQRESLRQAEHLFQSLLHRAFTTGL